MREFSTTLTETAFNAIWRSLAEREKILIARIESHHEESDEAIVANNDLIYLRGVKESLERQAKDAGFGPECFDVSEEIIDLSKM